MVNLLFISNSPKMDIIKTNLQPLLKVKIDIVNDFDYGLKDVFEKRPATVFIQEQIAGVTGESVARHIQMLLGSGAPTFIFMHEEGTKVKPIKGLFEHLIDLSQNNAKLVDNILDTLKSLLGPQWEKIYVPPKVTPSDVMSAGKLPLENRADADQLVDDLLSALDTFGPVPTEPPFPTTDFSSPVAPEEETMVVVSSQQDQLAELLVETAKRPVEASVAPAVAPRKAPAAPVIPPAPQKQAPPKVASSKPVHAPEPAPAAVVTKPVAPEPVPTAVVTKPVAPEPVAAAVSDISPAVKAAPTPVKPEKPETSIAQQVSPVSPAEFRIGGDEPDNVSIPADLLLAFEDNYRLQIRARKRNTFIVIILLVCLGSGWLLYRYKPQMPAFLKRQTQSAPVAVTTAKPAPTVVTVQKPVSTVRKTQAAKLPSFIPQSGLDTSYSAQNPGWERYLGPAMEFRLFRSDGRIKAVQVLANPGQSISDSIFKSILIELTGSSDFQVKSNEKKSGYLVSRATVKNNPSEMLIYRSNSAVRAVVVSLD